MDKLGRMQQLFDEVIKDNRELRHRLFLRGLNENDRRAYEESRRRRIERLQDEQSINNGANRWLLRSARRGNTFR